MTQKTKLFAYVSTDHLPEFAGKPLPASGVTYASMRYPDSVCENVRLTFIAEVEFDTPVVNVDRDVIIRGLQDQVSRAKAEHYKKVRELEDNIERLLAIENKG